LISKLFIHLLFAAVIATGFYFYLAFPLAIDSIQTFSTYGICHMHLFLNRFSNISDDSLNLFVCILKCNSSIYIQIEKHVRFKIKIIFTLFLNINIYCITQFLIRLKNEILILKRSHGWIWIWIFLISAYDWNRVIWVIYNYTYSSI
jgi:hypothetical protein